MCSVTVICQESRTRLLQPLLNTDWFGRLCHFTLPVLRYSQRWGWRFGCFGIGHGIKGYTNPHVSTQCDVLNFKGRYAQKNIFTLRHLSKRTLHCLEMSWLPGMQRYIVCQKAYFTLFIPLVRYWPLYIDSKLGISHTLGKSSMTQLRINIVM
jgi:hypothetical protein